MQLVADAATAVAFEYDAVGIVGLAGEHADIAARLLKGEHDFVDAEGLWPIVLAED